MKKLLKFTVVLVFVAFQVAQALHTHKAVSAENCQVCQATHQTLSVGADAPFHIVTRLVFDRLFVSQDESVPVADVVSSAYSRAPPTA